MSATTFSIMSFNIRCATANDGANHWELRKDLNLRTVRRHAPDILAVQEQQAPQQAFYARTLTDYQCVEGPPYNNVPASYAYPSIYFDPHRFELIREEAFWLSPTPDTHSLGWDTDCVRSALAVELRCRQTERHLIILNTHLDHRGAQARLEGSRLICERLNLLAQAGQSVLVAGDFNCVPHSAPYQVFQDSGYRDTLLDAGRADGPETFTFHAFTGQPAIRPTGRIDWILYRGGTWPLQVTKAQILRDAEPPLYPSDHFPVLARFESRI